MNRQKLFLVTVCIPERAPRVPEFYCPNPLLDRRMVARAISKEAAAKRLGLRIERRSEAEGGAAFYLPDSEVQVSLDETQTATRGLLMRVAGQLTKQEQERWRRYSEQLGPLGIGAGNATDAPGPS